ncbi:MAG: preprotein translocase subunit SecG [Candidatus Omnitrophota bacterium]|jgi:preprotein translocase subunit SecG|nr:MAG: preprotein translocase subunit SecG [Candidatus Omnitrophota bacterium]
MLYFLFCLFHIAVCAALIFFILIQSNKGMGLGGAFGSVGGDSVFGSSGSINILMKITIILGIIFATSSVALTMIKPPNPRGVMDQNPGTTSIQELIEASKAETANVELPAGDGMTGQPAGQPGEQPANQEPPQ